MTTQKTTILYLRQESLRKGETRFWVELIGDKPTESMAKRGVEKLLSYIKRIRRID